jgi:hypothetical protein
MKARIQDVKVLSCSASWRNYFFLKITTSDGVVGWSEFDENFGSPGVAAVIEQLSHRLIGQSAMNHEHIREDLRSVTRPGSGGVVGQALGAIENALLDATNCSAASYATGCASTGRTASPGEPAGRTISRRLSTRMASAPWHARSDRRALRRSRPTSSATRTARFSDGRPASERRTCLKSMSSERS